MDEKTLKALSRDLYVDVTTVGRRSGKPHTVEVMVRYVDGTVYLSNQPDAKRDWVANLYATPEFTYALKQSVHAAFRARAVPVTDEAERKRVFPQFLKREGRLNQLRERLAKSHLFRVEFLDGS